MPPRPGTRWRYEVDVPVDPMHPDLIAATTQRGWPTELKRTGDEFRRWQISGPEVVLVDLAIDSPATGEELHATFHPNRRVPSIRHHRDEPRIAVPPLWRSVDNSHQPPAQ